MKSAVFPKARDEYFVALAMLLGRLQDMLRGAPALPVRMYVAGGAALYLHTGAREVEDVDAVFSQPLVLGENLEVAYADADGRARVLYLDRSDTPGLVGEGAYGDAASLELPGIDPKVLEVRVLAPVDIAARAIEDARRRLK